MMFAKAELFSVWITTLSTKSALTQTDNIIIATLNSVAERRSPVNGAIFFEISDLVFSTGLFSIIPCTEDIAADAYCRGAAFDGDRII